MSIYRFPTPGTDARFPSPGTDAYFPTPGADARFVGGKDLRFEAPGFGGSGGPATDAAVTAIRADGWSVSYTSPPTMDPVGAPRYVVLSRPGFTTAGAPTTYSEALLLTTRVRLPFPNQATLDPSRVAMSDFIYSTDSIVGGSSPTNSSTEASPIPICNWAMPDRRVVGNTLPRRFLEVVAFHRNAREGEQVACVEWTITDGTNAPIVLRRSVSEVSGHPGDRNAVLVYRPAADVDISTLADQANITVNCKVYPWIGNASSVDDSATRSAVREFSPRVFRKWVARAAAPPLAYVATVAGSTPTVSTDPAVAAANPYGTPMAALEALRTFTTNQTDGCEIRLMSGTHVWSASVVAGTYTANAEVVLTRDPNVARASAILSFGSTANVASRCSWLRITDVSLTRTGTFTITGLAAGQIVLENVNFNNGGFSATWISGFSGGSIVGCDVTSSAASLFNAGTPENRLVRGLSGTGLANVEGWLVLGCALSGTTCSLVRGTRTQSGAIIAYNRITTGNTALGIAATENVSGCAIVQNVVEFTSDTSNPSLRPSGDSATGNTTHFVLHNNTFAGSFLHGRSNVFYNDTAPPSNRVHRLTSCVGNIHVQINTKHDVFAGVNDAYADAAGRVGGWSYLYGVGCRGEFSQFIDAQNGGLGGSFAQAYPGLNASIGTSNSVRNDPLFVSFQATTIAGVAGAGGGDYRLQTGSPAAARVAAPVLRFDLAGLARAAANDAAGAYRAA